MMREEWLQAPSSALFERSPVGIACLDPAGLIIECNSAFADFIGREAAALAGVALPTLIVGDDREDMESLLAELATQTCRGGSLHGVWLARDDGSERTATVVVAPVDCDGVVTGVLVHVIETASGQRVQAESAHAQRLQTLGRLTGGIAHDFNTLIAVMLGGCELLLCRHGPADPAHEELEQIRANALRARELVGQLLAFVRREPIRPGRLNVERAIDALVPLMRRLLGASIVVEVRHHAPPGALPTVRLDARQFDQVVLNLAVNAREAMPDGGRLDLRTGLDVRREPVSSGRVCLPPGIYVFVEVADTGCGIPQEIVDRIFEPFFTTRQGGEGAQGTGVGLATVLDIVCSAGGVVTVQSAVPKGSCFRILLPAQPERRNTGRQAETSLAHISLAHMSLAQTSLAQVAATPAEPPVTVPAMPVEVARRILLVDDEEIVRRFAARALRSRGYEVLEAADGEEALDTLSSSHAKVDLLLADLVLPGADGHAVVERALTVRPEMRAIVISAHLPEDGWWTANANVRDRVLLLPKPFTLAELATTVKKALDR